MYGIEYFEAENYTWGELIDYINVVCERNRRHYQNMSLIAFKTADIISSWVFKKDECNVADIYPYWNDEEKKQIQVEKYRNIMMQHASQKISKNNQERRAETT